MADPGDDGPPIAITSPDAGTTFAYGAVKTHSLVWDKRQKMLVAYVTFTDAEQSNGQPSDDSHQFRLPGTSFDETKGIFYATTKKGELIPVAQIKKALFFKTIVTTANANIRVMHPRGVITVVLEAISPNDPAMHPAPTHPDGTHDVSLDKIVN